MARSPKTPSSGHGNGSGGDAPSTPRSRSGSRGTAGNVSQAQQSIRGVAQEGRADGGQLVPPSMRPSEAPQQKALPPGRTTRSLAQIRNMRNRLDRAQAAEVGAREMYGAGPERHYPVALNNDPDFPVTRPGGRKVDAPVDLPDGTTLAIEVKMYQNYRTIELPDGSKTVEKVEVPLRSEIREQINKDVALRNADPSYDPRWTFYGAGPGPALREYLTKAGIIFVEHR